jgi:hypothetical protein
MRGGPASARLAPQTRTEELMPDTKNVILRHIAAVNERDSDAEPWAADAEPVARAGLFFAEMDFLGQLGLLPQ